MDVPEAGAPPARVAFAPSAGPVGSGTPVSSPTYRADIDGLRAVAVLSVLAYHLGIGRLAGGFLGVDVFFVISGFLITGVIRAQVREGRFRFGEFYVRRARRLLPASLVTTAVTLGVSCLVLAPMYLQSLAASAIAATFSVSNIYFFRQAGYFDTGAILKPLLHTWSLGVEEQFYLAWPALLVLGLTRLPGRVVPWLLLAAALIDAALVVHFRSHASAIFFLAPFRVFEFAIGALMVWGSAWRPRWAWVTEAALTAGLLLIAWPVLTANAERSFSDVRTVIPCLGAALVLYAGQARYTGVLLRHPTMVGIGVISYSLYLVHWPIIVLWKYDHFGSFTGAEQLLLAGASLGAALLLYHFVEKPVRRRGAAAPGGDRRVLRVTLATIAVLVACAWGVWYDGGLLHRYPASVRVQIEPARLEGFKQYTWSRFGQYSHPFAEGARRHVMIIGDSQAADFVNMLAENGLLRDGEVRTVRLDRQCQSLITMDPADLQALDRQDEDSCRQYFNDWVGVADLDHADVVVLAFQWYERGIDVLDRAVATLRRRGVRQVVVIGRKSQGFSGADIILRRGIGPEARPFSAANRNTMAWEANAVLAARARAFTWVDLMRTVCETPAACDVFDPDGNALFFDGSHLTPSGARELGRRLRASGALAFLDAP